MKSKLELKDMTVSVELPIFWGDMDAFAHVNNVRYFRFFESVRIRYFEQVALYSLKEQTGIGPILAETSCKYIRPLTYPDQIKVGCRTIQIHPEHLEQQYLVWSSRLQQTAAVGQAIIKAYDYNKLKKSIFPEELLQTIRELERAMPSS